jgi:hypothetical protein
VPAGVSYKKKYEILFASLKSLKKGVGSESVSHRHGSTDPHQNVTDPQHWQKSYVDDKEEGFPKPRVQRQRRHSIAAGGQNVVLNWFDWNLPLHATHWLAIDLNSNAAHWSDQNLCGKIPFLSARLYKNRFLGCRFSVVDSDSISGRSRNCLIRSNPEYLYRIRVWPPW